MNMVQVWDFKNMFLSEIHPKVRKELHKREFILTKKISQEGILDPDKENRDLLAESFAKSPWIRVFSPLDTRKLVSNKWKEKLQEKRMTLPEFGQSNRYFKGDKVDIWLNFKLGLEEDGITEHGGGPEKIKNPLGGYDTVLLQSGLMNRNDFNAPEKFGAKVPDEKFNYNKMYIGLKGVYGRGNKPGDPMDPVYKKDGTPTYKAGPTTPHGVMPIPGVKTISVSYTGEMKASKEATIEWVCWSFRDLERLTPHFLEMGKLVTLEWGWGGLGGDTPIPLDYDKIINATNQAEGRTNRISLHDEIQHIVFENGGNYDAMVGVISNFEWTLRSDGGFDCTTKLKSRGVNIINQALGSPSNISGVKLKTDKDEEDNTSSQLTFDKFMDQMVSYIKELTSTMQFESKHLRTYWDTIKKNPTISYSKEGFIKYMRNAAKDPNAFADDTMISDGIFWPAGFGYINDDEVGPWLSWGWIEDNILSRFLGKVDKYGTLIQEFRSVDSIYRNGKFIGYEPVKISNHRQLITVDPDICIIPGQYPLYLSDWESDFWKGQHGDSTYGFIAKFLDDRMGNTPFTPPPFTAYQWKSPEEQEDEWGNGSYSWVHPSQMESVKDYNIQVRGWKVDPVIPEAGYMRHLLIHIDTFKDAFEGVSSVEAACQSLFNKLNSTTGIWDLHLATSGDGVKVVDRNYTEEKVKTLLIEPSVWKYPAASFKDDTKLPDGKVYKFPSWQRDSMVKSQTLSAKFSDSAAVIAMYGGIASPGANPSEGSGNPADFLASSALQSTIDPTQPNVSGAWEQRYGRDGKFGTKYPYNLSVDGGDWENFGVGNGFDFDISTVSGAPGGNIDTNVETVNTAIFLREGLITNLQAIYQATGKYTESDSKALFINMEQFEDAISDYHKGKSHAAKSIEELQKAPAQKKDASASIVEIYDSKTGKLRNNSPHAYVDAMKYLIGVNRATSIFGIGGSSPMLKIELDLEIQGIGGIVPGNAFNVSLLPDIYKDKVVFQATNVDQEISDAGWKTTLTGQMRVNISDQTGVKQTPFITAVTAKLPVDDTKIFMDPQLGM